MAIPIASTSRQAGRGASSWVARYSTAKRILGVVDHVFSRHRLCLFIYLGVFVKMWNLDFMKELSPPPVLKTMDEYILRDAETEVPPLSRSSIHSVVESQSGSALPDKVPQKRRRILFADVDNVKSKSDASTKATKCSEETDATRILKRVLAESHTPLQDYELTDKYTTLANMYSARGQYAHAVDAMDRALQVAVDAYDRATAQEAFGRLELKHHRYEAAAVRFADALNYGKLLPAPDPVLHAVVLGGAGWAELMRGRIDEANARFRELLKEATVDISSPELFTSAACKPRGHVLDGCRAHAMAGLSIVLVHQGLNATNGTSPRPSEVAACAANFLVRASVDDAAFDGPCDVPLARRALGLAYLALGQTQKARQQYRQVWQMELDSSYAWPAIGAPPSPVGSTDDLCRADFTRCSHTELNMGLVELQAGDSRAAELHVDRMLEAAKGFPEEAAEWLARFSEAHDWLSPGYSALLSGRVAPVLAKKADVIDASPPQ